MQDAWVSLRAFLGAYTLFVVLPARRALTACSGVALLILTGVLGWREALTEKIAWNVMGLFFGTPILAGHMKMGFWDFFFLEANRAFSSPWSYRALSTTSRSCW